MAIKKFCDKCGRELKKEELSNVGGKYIAFVNRYLSSDIDICSTCATAFAKWWNPGIDQNKEKVDGRFLC